MKIAVIGAGWAGAACAWKLQQASYQVTVYEASRHIGGRARSNYNLKMRTELDNGQHILLGAYTSTLQLIHELGLKSDKLFLRQELAIRSADGQLSIITKPWIAPFHLLGAVLLAKGLSLAEKWQLLRLTSQLQLRKWQVEPGLTVQQWLEQGKQSPRLVRLFWQPLCVAAMNTPIQLACAQLFAHVLRDSLGARRQDSQTLIPLVGLSPLWASKALSALPVQLGTRVQAIAPCSNGQYRIHDTHYHAVVVAAQAPHAQTLLETLPERHGSTELLAQLKGMSHLPIATIYLELERPWKLPHPMWLLKDHATGLKAGQWLFDHSCLKADKASSIVAIVISDAGRLQGQEKTSVIAAVIEQVKEQTEHWAGAMPGVVKSEMIVERRASFAATAGLARPENSSPWPGIFLAGDWTNTGYPGVLEGAVRSGLHAAKLVQSALPLH